MSYQKLTPITAKEATEPRYLEDRFSDNICVEDFGAIGDGSTDDTEAFSALEEVYTERRINLHNKTFKVSTAPCKNYYYNGFWKEDSYYDESIAETVVAKPAYNDNVRMEYGSVHSAGSQTAGRNYCVLNDADLEDVWKTNAQDVIAIGEGTLKAAFENHSHIKACTAIGRGVMAKGANPGYQNIGIGTFALHNITSGHRNIAIGALSMLFSETCRQTIALGRDVAQNAVDGTKNTLLGYRALSGSAPVGPSTWIEKQNEVTPRRLVVVGTDAAREASGVNKDAIIIGVNSAKNAKCVTQNTIIGTGACENIGLDTSYEGYDLVTGPTVTGTYTTNNTSTITITLASIPYNASLLSNLECVFDSTDETESLPLYSFNTQPIRILSVNGTTITAKLLEYDNGNLIDNNDIIASGTGTCKITFAIIATYTTNNTSSINIALNNSLQNYASVGRRVFATFIADESSPIIASSVWLRITAVTTTGFTAIDDNENTEGDSASTFTAGTGAVIISSFELSTQTNSNHKPYLSAVFGGVACNKANYIYEASVFGQGAAEHVPSLYRSTVFGYRAAVSATSIDECILIGHFAGGENLVSDNSIFIGQGTARTNSTINYSVVIGPFASVGKECSASIAVGYHAGVENGDSTLGTYIGAYAGNGVSVTGSQRNVALGYHAMDANPGGTSPIVIEDSVAIGNYAQVTGSNQIQLGTGDDTVYAYGAIQDRSDARDKADIRDTILGIDFIKSLRPVDFRWDYRDDYIDRIENKDGSSTFIKHEKDGSRKRNRYHHGLIAQEVKKVLDSKGIDFGGYQDHSINGGADVLTLGYEEFIGPLIKAVQELSTEIEQLKNRINQLTNN